MGSHPLNLMLRFLLELAAWGALAYWGWVEHTDAMRYILTVGLPVVAMAIWAIFRVPGDPDEAPVEVPGWVRLTIELGTFGLAAGLLAGATSPALGFVLIGVVLVHYALSYDRIRWLLKYR
jgi:hypothetical protein